MVELEYSVEAVGDIDAIIAFSIDRFGPAVASAYLTGLELACDQLRTFPERSPIYPRLQPEMRCLIYQRHRIFYRFNGQTVLIVRILHHAQDVEEAMS